MTSRSLRSEVLRISGSAGCVVLGALLFVSSAPCRSSCAGDIFGHSGLMGGMRWDAAPRVISGRERSLVGGLRYSLEGGSYQAFRDMFSWSVVPSAANFQLAVEQAFGAWGSVDPVSGLDTDLRFVSDFATPVVGTGLFGGVNTAGAEIDVFGNNAGDAGTRAVSFFDAIGATVTLTSGTPAYPGSFAISGADININSNPGAVYSLDLFRRLLTHEIGHAIGLGDVENANASAQFIDDNYNGATSATALATLTNSWAALVNPLNPALSPLSLYVVRDANPGIDTPGVNILMESNGLGIAPGNPVTNLIPLVNDDYGTRQFLYPFVPEPATAWMAMAFVIAAAARRRRTTNVVATGGHERPRIAPMMEANGSVASTGPITRGTRSHLVIAVGTAVTGGPPHRPVREGLPHTVPALSRTRKRWSG